MRPLQSQLRSSLVINLQEKRISSHPITEMGKGRKKKHPKKRASDQLLAAAKHVARWANIESGAPAAGSFVETASASQDWVPTDNSSLPAVPVIDLHTHSTCSDGTFSPLELVEKAAVSGVQVLALTDHDTMAGVPAALEAAKRFGMRLIPGVEISARVRMQSGVQDNVHILGYYSCCGPARWQELEKSLARIREGRYHRAEAMLSKLKILKKPVTWEQVINMAGAGVAPGRMHVARAMVEAGHVDCVREAFNKYLHDGGPAYALGYELAAEDAVRLVCDTGGVAALAHPWALKDPLFVIKALKAAGLHAMEVYRSDGKANGFTTLADAYQLVKLGGSDFHGRGDPDETKLGKVPLPLLTIHEFLHVAEPIWCSAIKEILQGFAAETFKINSGKIVGLKYFSCGSECLKGDISLGHLVKEGTCSASLSLSSWLMEEERLAVKEEVSHLNLVHETITKDGKLTVIVRQQVTLPG